MKKPPTILTRTLGSRKFWAAVTASAPFAVGALHDSDPLLMVEHWENFAMVWMAYAGIQGTVDALEGHGVKRAQPPEEVPDGVPEVIDGDGDISTVRDGIPVPDAGGPPGP